jgi:hypothetical protein
MVYYLQSLAQTYRDMERYEEAERLERRAERILSARQ